MWREEKIGNELDVIRGVSFPKSAKKSEYREGRVACLRTANVQTDVDWSDLWFIDKDHVNRKEQFVQVNDILISTANSLELLGKVSLVRKLPYESTLGTFIVNIRVPDGNSPKFIYYQLCGRDFLEQVWNRASTTTNISNLSTTKLKDITLKFPSLPTQNRIVEKIEELFSELDNGVENLKKARQQLKTYRQAVLKDAFEGKITAAWRKQQDDLPTAEELLRQIKAERKAHRQRELAEWEKEVEQWEKDGMPGRKPRKPRKVNEVEPISEKKLNKLADLPNNWLWLKLGRVIDQPKYGTSEKCDYDFDGFGVLRIPNIGKEIVNSEDMKYAPLEEDEASKYALQVGDILTIRSNGSIDLVGKCALIREPDTNFLHAGYLIRLRPYKGVADSRYLLNVLSSVSLRSQIESKAKSTSGVNNINSGELQDLIIPLCSIKEQKEIVKEIESRLSVVDQLEQTIKENLQKAEALRQSILKKAFGGELV